MTRAPCATRSGRGFGTWRRRPGTCRPGSRASCSRPRPTRAPEGPDWLFEIKYDGVRVLAERRGDAVTLVGRSGQIVTARYPEVVAALRALAFDRFLIDGEIVALDARGISSFQRLQARMGLTRPGDVARAMAAVPVEAVFFDCLALEGHDLRRVPLAARKGCLAARAPAARSHALRRPRGGRRTGLPRGRHRGPARGYPRQAGGERLRRGTLGRVAQDQVPASPGIRDRRLHRPPGRRARFGALHVGVYDGGRLVYVSKVGTGFDSPELDRLWQRLEPLRRESSPFDVGTPAGRGHHWVEPRLVCEVRFTDWTRDGGIRHPTYVGLRDDVRPEACHREVPDTDDWAGDRADPDRDRGGRGRDSPRDGRGRSGAPPGPRRPPDQPRQGLLAGRGLHEGRPDPLLRHDRAL